MYKQLRQRVKNQSFLGRNEWIGILLFGVIVLLVVKAHMRNHNMVHIQSEPVVEEQESVQEETILPEQEELALESKEESQSRDFPSIPFYIQAPQGQWSDPIFQNACEEASMLMAADALTGKVRTLEEITVEIEKIARWQKLTFGTNVDTNTSDVARTLKEYFLIPNVQIEENLSVEKIQKIVDGQSVLLVPLNGQKLNNPHFTAPGPKTHMVVITGYDENSESFIVHDPGTQFGKNYQYKEGVLVKAIGDYPTGNHLPYKEPLLKKGVKVGITH